jgi:hypothetical protein
MTTYPIALPAASSHSRWFYSIASLSLLVLMFVGFNLFYLQGRSFPGRPLTPPIRTLIIIHGCLMTAWMLLAVGQPLLVGARRKHLHRKLGVLGVILATGMVIAGVHVGIESARVAPPELRIFRLDPMEFMAVPVLSILLFALLVTIGVVNRRRPEVHRPMMLMASVAVIGAALARIPQLNALYAGTWWELMFTAFFMQVVCGAILLVTKCIVSRSFDRWFAIAFVILAVGSAAISLGAKTQAWHQFATFLLR